MGEHDIIETLDCSVRCACGLVIVRDSLEAARASHGYHFGIMLSRAALEGARDGA